MYRLKFREWVERVGRESGRYISRVGRASRLLSLARGTSTSILSNGPCKQILCAGLNISLGRPWLWGDGREGAAGERPLLAARRRARKGWRSRLCARFFGVGYGGHRSAMHRLSTIPVSSTHLGSNRIFPSTCTWRGSGTAGVSSLTPRCSILNIQATLRGSHFSRSVPIPQ